MNNLDKFSFTAIDFETANYNKNSVCSIGLARFERGELVHQFSSLVQPPNNEYLFKYFTQIHGIKPSDTIHSKTFDLIYPEVSKYFENQTIVAHNGKRFDFHVINKVLSHYNIVVPNFERVDTMVQYPMKLNIAVEQYFSDALKKSINFDHHNALKDALACGYLYLIHLIKQYPEYFDILSKEYLEKKNVEK